MRKWILVAALFGALVTALFGVVVPASASPSVPMCLISNGGSGGRFTKTLLCVELLDRGEGHAGSGSYSPGDGNTVHWLTESVEFQPLGRDSVWLPLASARQHGTGRLAAVTRTVSLPAPGALRACTRAGTEAGGQPSELCSTPVR